MTTVLRRSVAVPLAVGLLLSACADGEGAAPTTVTTTTLATTTTASTTTTEPRPTTTTTTEPLPVPLPAPEEWAKEPLVQLGRIEIPSIGLDNGLFEGVTLRTLNRGPGHWPGTAQPGHLGNVVIGGHRTSHTHPFRHLDKLVRGDKVILTTLEGRFVYLVTETLIVTPDEMWVIDQHREYTATLFACHPLHSTSHRIIVFLQMIPNAPVGSRPRGRLPT